MRKVSFRDRNIPLILDCLLGRSVGGRVERRGGGGVGVGGARRLRQPRDTQRKRRRKGGGGRKLPPAAVKNGGWGGGCGSMDGCLPWGGVAKCSFFAHEERKGLTELRLSEPNCTVQSKLSNYCTLSQKCGYVTVCITCLKEGWLGLEKALLSLLKRAVLVPLPHLIFSPLGASTLEFTRRLPI